MKGIKGKLLCLLPVAAAALLFCGCGDGSVRVTFDANGGTMAVTQADTVEGGKLPAVPAPVRSGYVFTGWYTDSTCTEDSKWQYAAKVDGAMTLYAGWTAESNITVRYDLCLSDGESAENAPASAKYRAGSFVGEPVAPSRSGYVFKYWCSDRELNNRFGFLTTKVDSDTTLYAKWVRLCNVTVHMPAGGTRVEKLEEGSTYSVLSVPDTGDSLFIGYYADAGFTAAVNMSDTVSKDTDIYVKAATVTDTSLYNIRIEKYDYSSTGVAYISTKTHMSELVLPARYNGILIEGVYFDDKGGKADDENAEITRLDVDTIVFPASIRNIGINGYADRVNVKRFEAAYALNAYIVAYDGCLYSQHTNWTDVGEVRYYSLTAIPTLKTGVINMMPGAVLNYIPSGYVYKVSAPPSEQQFEQYIDGTAIVLVPGRYLSDYMNLNHNEYVRFYRDDMYDARYDMIRDGNRLIKYVGNSENITVGVDDGITVIASGAFDQVQSVTIGENITDIEGVINTRYWFRVTFVGACPAKVRLDNILDRYNSFYLTVKYEYLESFENAGLTAEDYIRYNCYVIKDGEEHSYQDILDMKEQENNKEDEY